MPIDLNKALSKLDRPPSGYNWVRFVHGTRPETTRSILSFVKGVPPFTYGPGSTAIKDRLLFGIGLDAAIRVTQRTGSPAGREHNKELVEAFFEYDKTRAYPFGTCIEFERQYFRISRELLVPVSPLVILRESGRFVPVFLCGWRDVALDRTQRRLLMTIYEDAFLSLTDFHTSPAEFLFFPKREVGLEKKRIPEIWQRGDYELLSPTELDDQVRLYLEAREEARTILLTAKATAERQRENERRGETASEPNLDGDLFAERDPKER